MIGVTIAKVASRLDHGLKSNFMAALAAKKSAEFVYLLSTGATKALNPHQRFGYSNSPFAGEDYFYTAGSTNESQGVGIGGTRHKKEVAVRQTHLFIEPCVRDIICRRNLALDLLQLIIRPTRLSREELQRISSNMQQFRSPINEFRACLFGCPEKS